MNQWRFEVFSKDGFVDVHGGEAAVDIKELGIDSVGEVHFSKVFLIEADIDEAFAWRIANELLCDSVSQDCHLGRKESKASESVIIEVHLKSGVTDPVAESVVTAIKDMGKSVDVVRTARKYELVGHVTD